MLEGIFEIQRQKSENAVALTSARQSVDALEKRLTPWEDDTLRNDHRLIDPTSTHVVDQPDFALLPFELDEHSDPAWH